MNRWTWGWIIIGIFAILIVFSRATSPELLKDSDTILILNGIKARGEPLSWFGSDWPLGNHFYRPVVSLLFEMDLALYGKNAAGFGLTNALLAAMCVLSLFWLLREVTDNLWLSSLGASLFGMWNLFGSCLFLVWFGYAVCGISIVSLMIPGRPKGVGVLSFCAGLGLVYELTCFAPFRYGIVEWLPGRTASCATLFCLAALACYARSLRIASPMLETARGPLDPPATKGTIVAQKGLPLPWLASAALFEVVALCSYEQAVVLPGLMGIVAFAFVWKKYQVDWRPHIAFWLLLLIYLVLRYNVIPPGTSSYQEQQFRNSGGVFLSIFDYLFPAAREVLVVWRSFELGLGTVILTQGLTMVVILANVCLGWGLVKWLRKLVDRVERSLLVAVALGFVASLFAFLPMAFLKPFGSLNHYHYFSLALRTLFVAALLQITGEWLICALSPQALQAPKRLAPAPGSLPRR
ncbi:MAG: hypothetical protein ABL949_15325 [Fimbriimonadaceae bacterium]